MKPAIRPSLVSAAGVIILLAGIGIGYFAIPNSKGTSAECVILSNDLQKLTYRGDGQGSQRATEVVDLYNKMCR